MKNNKEGEKKEFRGKISCSKTTKKKTVCEKNSAETAGTE